MIISVSLDMLSPQITKKVVDDVIVGGEFELLPKLLLTVLIIGLGRFVFQYLKEFTFDLTGSKIATDIRKNLFHHIQSLSIDYFDKTNTGELMSRVKDDVNNIWDSIAFVGMLLIEVVIHTSIVLYCMLKLSPKLTLIPIIAMPIAGLIAFIMEKKLDKVYEDISEENAKLNTVAQENISGVRTVKSFAREKFEIKKFLSHNKKYYDLNMKQSKVFVKYDPFFMLLTKIIPILVIIFGGVIVVKDGMSLGSLTAFVEYSNNIVWPMEMLGWLCNSLASAVASNKKIQKIYKETSTIKEPEHPKTLTDVKGQVTFDHVSLNINEKVILEDISFDLQPGKSIGIMGATGTGKTSIIHLLQRFYDATQGEILLDGINIKDLSLSQLRSNISTVMQDVFLFSDTINENIKLGKKHILDHEDIKDAAALAQADEFIESMEDQYETVVGERGVGLSGGQKQRISLARAFVKENPVLILDDSTSALDMETELKIQQALNSLHNTSKIIIAHRISAVRHADEIIVLHDGKIMERGTHEGLLQQKGYYYDTFIAQYGDYLSTAKDDMEVIVCQ